MVTSKLRNKFSKSQTSENWKKIETEEKQMPQEKNQGKEIRQITLII